MKEFDFKQLMLQKGEKIGLYVGLGVMALLLLFGGVSTVKSDSPNTTADIIQAKTATVKNRVESGEATSLDDIPPETKGIVSVPPVQPDKFAIKADHFVPNPLEDTKRRNPDIQKPDAFQVDLIRASVRFYDVIQEGGKIKIGKLVPIEKETIVNKDKVKTRREVYLEKLQEFYKSRGIQLPTPPQNTNKMSSKQLANLAGEEAKFRLEHVPMEQVDSKEKLAITMYPGRMVVVSASFPFKAQLEAYRKALRLPSMAALLAPEEKDSLPAFLGINVQRRTVKHNVQMKEEEGWEDLDTTKEGVQWASYRWLLQRAVEPEPEDATPEDATFAQAVILNKSMVMPRPKLGKNTDVYPRVKLKTITDTVTEYKKVNRGQASLQTNPFNRRLSGEADIFNIEGSGKPPEPATLVNTGSAKPDFVPDHILIRFIDVTVKPSFTYEYRMQVRATNPNFEKKDVVAYPYLAEVKELKAPWAVLPQVSVPSEFYYYTVEEKPANYYDRDLVHVQMHRWLDYVRLNPAQRDTEVPVADWTIREVPAHRGEYIGQLMDRTEVVIWYPTREVFDFAINPIVLRTPRQRGTPVPKGIPVDFSTNPRALLVDFEGGKGQVMTYRRANEKIDAKVQDDSSVELLVLTEDGRLLVRNSRQDNENEERKVRYNTWKEEIGKIKEKPAGLKKDDDVFKTTPKN